MNKDNTIRVGELIECLKEFPEDTCVYIKDNMDDDNLLKVNSVTFKVENYPGCPRCLTYILLSYDNDIEDYSERQK